jgi:hypothetical protein
MPPTEHPGKRIVENGYRYSCFVSWPSKSSNRVKRIVKELKTQIADEATDLGLPPAVFDSGDIETGIE